MKETVDMSTNIQMISETSIDVWFQKFQLNHNDADMVMNADTLRDLAYNLHNDIPLGYEGSMRLGSFMLDAARYIESILAKGD